jgi:hypothetical protein
MSPSRKKFPELVAPKTVRLSIMTRLRSRIDAKAQRSLYKLTSHYRILRPSSMRFCSSWTLPYPRMPRRRASAQGKSVTFGVKRGCIAVASPVSSITWLIAP